MELMECSICCDGFSIPKLLPCRHSFCLNCLKDYIRTSKVRNQVKCPLCRNISKIPPGGAGQFMDNYFVDIDTRTPQGAIATFPESEDNIRSESLESEENIRDDSDLEDDVNVPFSLVLFIGRIQTKFKATLMSMFSTGAENCINGIYPVSNTESWVIPGGGPDLVMFNVQGQEIRRLPVGSRFCDLAVREELRDVLLVMPDDCAIGKVKIDNGEFSRFASTGICSVGDMSSFPDGRIVVVGSEASENANEKRGKVQIFSSNGEFLSGLAKQNDDFNPFAVAVNPILQTVSVVDSSKRCVYTLLQNGDILNIYSGGVRSLLMLERPFVPLGICYDMDGNLLIVDGGSSVLHVLNSFGDFLGLILTNCEEQFGEPFCISVDRTGQLWIGDRNDGTVRVFRVSAYINHFRSVEDNE